MCHSELKPNEIRPTMIQYPVKPSGDVEVRRRSNQGSDQGRGDWGSQPTRAQARKPKTPAQFDLWQYCADKINPQPLVWLLSELLLNAWRADQELQRAHRGCHQCSHGLGARGQFPGQISQVSNLPVSGGPLLPEQETCSAHHRAGPCRPRQSFLGRQPCGHRPQPLHPGDKVNLYLETFHLESKFWTKSTIQLVLD